ncbi:hypothetical protein PLESTM_001833500 [Pleodorina starrii]|nr:hypothetical protein PLESTM_001833500 [Pleodorina starrii]
MVSYWTRKTWGAKARRLADVLGENLRYYISEYPSPGSKTASPFHKNKSSPALTVGPDMAGSLGAGDQAQRSWFGRAESKKQD